MKRSYRVQDLQALQPKWTGYAESLNGEFDKPFALMASGWFIIDEEWKPADKVVGLRRTMKKYNRLDGWHTAPVEPYKRALKGLCWLGEYDKHGNLSGRHMKALQYLRLLIEDTYCTAVALADRRNQVQENKLTTLEYHPRLSQTAKYVIGGIQSGAQALADLASIAVLLAPEAGVRPRELMLNSEHPLSVLLTLSNHIMGPMFELTATTKCPIHHDSMFESNSPFGFNNPKAFRLESRCGKKGFTPTAEVIEHTISKFKPRDRDNRRSGCPMQFAMARDGKTPIAIEMFRWVAEIIDRFATQT